MLPEMARTGAAFLGQTRETNVRTSLADCAAHSLRHTLETVISRVLYAPNAPPTPLFNWANVEV